MIKDTISEFKAGFDPRTHTELRLQRNTNRRTTLLCGNLVGNARSESSGVSARVYLNGVYGFASNGATDNESVAAVLKAATDNAIFMDSHVGKNKPVLTALNCGTRSLEKGLCDTEQKTFIDFSNEIDEYLIKNCPKLTSRTVVVTCDSMEKLLKVDNGWDAHTIIPRSYIYFIMSAETDSGITVESFTVAGGFGGFTENFTDPKLLFPQIDDQYAKLMQKREGVYPDAGLKTCIIGSEVTGILAHEAVGHTVEADLVLGGSVASTALGKQVASEKVTLIDYANETPDGTAPLPVYVDDEGTLATDELIIDKGMLVGYMNNRESADHFGMVPHGNARAFAFSDEPLIRMRNTGIVAGTDKLEDMIASVDDGYYFTSTNNGQADTTGEFMFGITSGYEIKNGKLGRAILDTTISGVAFDMLKTVDMVSDQMTWTSSGFCGKKQPMPVGCGGPDLRCKITVGGR